jgi:peptide/nickel transport system substrate-binding protein
MENRRRLAKMKPGSETQSLVGLILLFLVILFAPAVNAAAPKHGGTFIFAVEGEEANLNPHVVHSAANGPIEENIFNLLITQDLNFNFVPSLAAAHKVSKDGLTYTFSLVKNAAWHDGKPFTSADAVYTLKEIYRHNARAGSHWQRLNPMVEAPDKYTVVIKIKEPFTLFLDLLASTNAGAYIFPKHLYEGTDLKKNPYDSRPIGTGPFLFKEWVRGSHIELARNPNYFARGKEGKPYIDRLVFRVIPDPSTRVLALRKGDVDFIPANSVPLEEAPDLRKDARIIVDPPGAVRATTKFLYFNLRNTPLSNKTVRQAIAHAIDKKKIIDLVVLGEGKEAKSIVSSVMKWAYNPKVPDYGFSLDRANSLLDKAGYPRSSSGTRFKVRLSCIGGRGSDPMIAEVMRDQLKQVGIDVQIVSADRAAFVDALFMRWDFDLAIQQAALGPDPMIGVSRLIHSNNIKKAAFANGVGYSNPEVDKLLDEEFRQISRDKRAAMWRRVQEIVMEELPYLPIYEHPQLNTRRTVWADVNTGPNGDYYNLEDAYLRK